MTTDFSNETQPLYMVSLPINMKELNQWVGFRGFADDEGRALHHLLSESFGKSILQPFRLMVAPGARDGLLYAYSRTDSAQLTETMRETAAPEALQICNMEKLAVKTMPDLWRTGRRLAFDVRVRPVKRLLKPLDKFKKGAELDAYLVDSMRHSPVPPPRDERLARADVYARWLAERLQGAATLTKVELVKFSRTSTMRDLTIKRKIQEGPDATFHGELVVQDGAQFAERLARGVGRHTAYGFGMLLLRPAG